MADKRPDLKTFLEDPAFQHDRELFGGFVEHFLQKKAEEARKKAEEENAANPPSIFDQLFGGK
jgi:hypothetical protein